MAYNPSIGSIYHLYTTYILPSGGLYATYHLLGEPETTIESCLIFLQGNKKLWHVTARFVEISFDSRLYKGLDVVKNYDYDFDFSRTFEMFVSNLNQGLKQRGLIGCHVRFCRSN